MYVVSIQKGARNEKLSILHSLSDKKMTSQCGLDLFFVQEDIKDVVERGQVDGIFSSENNKLKMSTKKGDTSVSSYLYHHGGKIVQDELAHTVKIKVSKLIGDFVVTSAGQLNEHGVELIFHLVVIKAGLMGDAKPTATCLNVVDVFSKALVKANEMGLRSVCVHFHFTAQSKSSASDLQKAMLSVLNDPNLFKGGERSLQQVYLCYK